MLKRLVLTISALLIVATLISSGFAHAQGGGDENENAPPYLTWDDAPVVDEVRHQADAICRWEFCGSQSTPTENFEIGMRTEFILGKGPGQVYTFELLYISDFAYFWFQPNADVNPDDLRAAATRFDQEIWPLVSAIYGGNISPGIDNDIRVHLVHAEGVSPTLAGYFSPDDQCPREICPDSNERDTLYLMIDYGPVYSTRYMATLAHELQHLIRFQTDGNEYRWLDEGVSQLVEHLTGFNEPIVLDNSVSAYLNNPNHPLNTWSIDYGAYLPFYGSGYLFSVYLFERFGLDFIQTLMNNPLDGLAAVNNTLKLTGQSITLNELVADWHVTNLLNNPYVGDGRYYYSTYSLPGPIKMIPLTVRNAPTNHRAKLEQYGAEYLRVERPGHYTLTFNGKSTSDLVPVAPASGNAMWWSNNAVASATSLTRTVDLTGVDAATLRYNIWWETGQFPGYLHVLASTDGINWRPQRGKATIVRDAFEEAPGEHYSGRSNRWVSDSIDLSAYAGQEVQIRFEYITNNAVAGPGFLLDNIEIPEIGWLDDVENDTEGWAVNGFLRTGQHVEQDWKVRLITQSAQPEVIDIPVDSGQASVEIDIPEGGAVIMVSAMAPFTLAPGDYQLTLNPLT